MYFEDINKMLKYTPIVKLLTEETRDIQFVSDTYDNTQIKHFSQSSSKPLDCNYNLTSCGLYMREKDINNNKYWT